MTTLTATYNATEYAWVTNVVTLKGSIALEVNLKKKGIVVIKKQNKEGEENPKVYISKYLTSLSLDIVGDANGKIIQVLTSEEPNYIRYEYIQR